MEEKQNFNQHHNKKLSLNFFLLVAVMISLLLFGVLVHEVLGEKENSFDFSVSNYLSSHLSAPPLTPIMESLSFLASRNFLLIVYIVLILWYVYKNQKRRALEILLVGLIGFLINYFMKFWYHRPRPSNPLIHPSQNFSFPSGHATSAFVFYGLLIYLVWQTNLSKTLKWVAAVFLVLVALAIGFSRIYLRMHYTSDVIAGFFIGFAWTGFAVWLFVRKKELS